MIVERFEFHHYPALKHGVVNLSVKINEATLEAADKAAVDLWTMIVNFGQRTGGRAMPILKHGSFLKFNYPFHQLLWYMYDVGHRINGHVLQIGPIAFCIVWRGEKLQPEQEAR